MLKETGNPSEPQAAFWQGISRYVTKRQSCLSDVEVEL